MNILLGGGGFIGTNIQEILYNDYYLIVDKEFRNIISTKFDYIQIDLINEIDKINQLVLDIKNDKYYDSKLDKNPEIINLHILAANLGVDNVINISDYLENEIQMYNNIKNFIIDLINLNKYKMINIFFYSTSEVYGDIKYMTETGPQLLSSIEVGFNRNRYAISKLYMEYILNELIVNYQEKTSTKLNLLIIRPFNVIGKYQTTDFLIPKLIYNGYTQNKLFVYGDGSQKRTFIDVREFVNALDRITQVLIGGGKVPLVMNFANIQNNFSITEVASMIQSLFEEKNILTQIEYIDIDSLYIGPRNRIPDVNRFYNYFKPLYKFRDTLRWIFDWEIEYINEFLK